MYLKYFKNSHLERQVSFYMMCDCDDVMPCNSVVRNCVYDNLNNRERLLTRINSIIYSKIEYIMYNFKVDYNIKESILKGLIK